MTPEWAKMEEKELRHAFMAQTVRRGLNCQIRSIREQRGMSQEKLAKAIGCSVDDVVLMETDENFNFTINGLIKIAMIFNVALLVRFVGWDEFMDNYVAITPDGLYVASYGESAPCPISPP